MTNKQNKRKRLSKTQLAVLEDLFDGGLDEQQVLEKHNVTRNTYHKWLADEQFSRWLTDRITSAAWQSQLVIARYASAAAIKLIELTESKSQETARKACLDIISLPKSASGHCERSEAISKVKNRDCRVGFGPPRNDNQESDATQLSPETASRLLKALAEETADK